MRIAAGETADAEDWRDIAVPPGRLFVVGDPKQSIYRFRRADIATYLDAAQHLGEEVSLTTNFRTVAPVLDWVNAVFADLIQPSRRRAAGVRRRWTGTVRSAERGPGVTVLGRDAAPGPSERRGRRAPRRARRPTWRPSCSTRWPTAGR